MRCQPRHISLQIVPTASNFELTSCCQENCLLLCLLDGVSQRVLHEPFAVVSPLGSRLAASNFELTSCCWVYCACVVCMCRGGGKAAAVSARTAAVVL